MWVVVMIIENYCEQRETSKLFKQGGKMKKQKKRKLRNFNIFLICVNSLQMVICLTYKWSTKLGYFKENVYRQYFVVIKLHELGISVFVFGSAIYQLSNLGYMDWPLLAWNLYLEKWRNNNFYCLGLCEH